MKKNNTKALIIGFLLLFFVISTWARSVGNVRGGFYSNDLGWIGNSPTVAKSQRAGINTKYALWTFLIVLGVGGYLYVNKNNNKETSLNNDIQSEIDSLKAKITDLENKQ